MKSFLSFFFFQVMTETIQITNFNSKHYRWCGAFELIEMTGAVTPRILSPPDGEAEDVDVQPATGGGGPVVAGFVRRSGCCRWGAAGGI